MEELKKFYNLVYRFRFIVISVPLITIIIAYFLVRNLPDQYVAEGQIATGIVDETQQSSKILNSVDKQESSIIREFSNFIEIMKLKKILNLVSYQLMIHDLTSDRPFRDLSSQIKDLPEIEKRKILNSFKRKYAYREDLNNFTEDDKRLSDLLNSMGYNEGFIDGNLSAERLEVSDFISVTFVSEDPELSAFVVNTACSEFINYYTSILKENQAKSVKFLAQKSEEKSDSLNKQVEILKQYKIKNGIINIAEQSSKVYETLAQYEASLEQAKIDVIAYRATIASIDHKIDPSQRKYFEASVSELASSLTRSKTELNKLSDKYIDSGFDSKYNKSLDSLKKVVDDKVAKNAYSVATNPITSAQELVAQKLTLQISLEIAQNSISSFKKVIAELNAKLTTLVPHEAVISTMERKIDVASEEYLDILGRYNNLSLEASISSKLRIEQIAMPGVQLPSKKMLLIILSGIISTIFCLLVFFVIFYFDNRIGTPRELAQITEIPVLGKINRVNSANLALKEIWSNLHGNPEMQELKKQLRSARYEISREMVPSVNTKGQVLNITSMNNSEGKTLLVACIAYSYVVISKKVLLIDGNFDHPSITENSNTKFFIEDYLKSGNLGSSEFNAGIMVMGNKGEDTSLFEITDEHTVRARFEALKSQFDIILIETPPLNTLSKAKEWNLIADKVMGVFEANQTISAGKQQHISYLKSLNGQFIGWVLNKVSVDSNNIKVDNDNINANFIE